MWGTMIAVLANPRNDSRRRVNAAPYSVTAGKDRHSLSYDSQGRTPLPCIPSPVLEIDGMNEWNLTFVLSDEGLVQSLQASVPNLASVVCLRQEGGWLVLSENKAHGEPTPPGPAVQSGGGAGSSTAALMPGSPSTAKGKS